MAPQRGLFVRLWLGFDCFWYSFPQSTERKPHSWSIQQPFEEKSFQCQVHYSILKDSGL
jgi:hypothetical protein